MADLIPIMGTYTYNLDTKNRIFIPAKHREALGQNFVAFPNLADTQSIVISSVEYMMNLIEKIRANTKLSVKIKREMEDYICGDGDTLNPDAQGRVVLSGTLVAKAGLGGSTVIRGCYDHAEIRRADTFCEVTREKAEELARLFNEAEII